MTAQWQYYISSSGALLKETVSFGVAVGLYSSSADRAWDDRVIRNVPANLPLELRVLKLLGEQTDPVQRAFRGAHDLLVEQGVYYSSLDDVLQRLEVSAYRDLFKWNLTKIAFWSHFLHDLGLLVRLPPERLVLSPGSRLLRAALAASQAAQGELRPLLQGWHTDYFAVFTRLGEVHEGVARGLLRLEAAGELELSYASDAAGSMLLCGRRISHYRRPGGQDVATL